MCIRDSAHTRGPGTQPAFRINNRIVGKQRERRRHIPVCERVKQLLLHGYGVGLREGSRSGHQNQKCCGRTEGEGFKHGAPLDCMPEHVCDRSLFGW